MDYAKAIEALYEHLENGAVDKAVMACLRIARHGRDYMSAAVFMRELYPNKDAVVRALYDDTQHLKREAQKYLYDQSLERWLEIHTVPFSLGENDDGEEQNVLSVAVGEIESEAEQWERSINDLRIPAGMGEFDTAAFTDRYDAQKAVMRLRIKGLRIVRERIKTNCLNYAIRVERQLKAQQKVQGFLEEAQETVNNYFKARSEDVYLKLQRATQLVGSTNTEDAALLLTQVRRAMKAAADHFYPATGKVTCADGLERLLGEEQYLNRVHEYLLRHVAKSSSRDLLEAEFSCLAAYFRRINEVASKGVHANVSLSEAKQGLIGLYMFLHNLCSQLENKEDEAKENQKVVS